MARNAGGPADWHARNVENAGIYANEEMLLVPVVYYYFLPFDSTLLKAKSFECYNVTYYTLKKLDLTATCHSFEHEI